MIAEIEKNIIGDLENLAAKYDLSLNDLERIISSRKEKNNFHIRFSESELKIVDDKSKKLGLNRSSYCALCFKKAVDEKLYESIDVLQVAKRGFGGESRTERVHISLKELGVNAQAVIEFANDIGVKPSALMRHFALTISL